VRIHETAASGGAVLVSGDHLASCSTSDVQLKIFHPEGNPEYISTPVRTPIDLKSVTKMDLRVFVPVGNPACSKITYRGHVSAQCIYEALESGSAGAMFQGLGDWRVRGISADGSVLVGSRTIGNVTEAVRWSQETGLVGLGHFPGGNKSYAYAASQDGSVIVGASDSGTGDLQAFRWTPSTGLVALGTLPGDSTSQAFDVASNGALVVGKSGNRAMVWTAGDSMQPLPGTGSGSTARGVSGDGTAIVGSTTSEDYNGLRAFRWTAGCGLVNITPREEMGSEAFGVSADGYTVGGNFGNHDDAFIWTPISGAIYPEIIDPEGAMDSVASDASADGSVVVGQGADAIIWDKTRCGAVYVEDVLTDELGLDLTGWQLDSARAVSDDGLTIAGSGSGPDGHSAWIARLG
jgi:probable HAF family extracellular repeat protein